jgi:hypothetical protein
MWRPSRSLEIVSVGIRDGPTCGRCPLPGDHMQKDLMNKVTEAKKAAAPRGNPNLISRREETAAMRSQAGHRPQGGPAKLLADNPTLMRLRELEVLEKIARVPACGVSARRSAG